MKKITLLFAITCPLFLHLFSLFFLHFDGSFQGKNFTHGFDKTYAKEVSGLDFTQLDSILLQPYTYLGHGKQMVAFVSEDGRYVLKLFNPMRPLKKNWYTRWKYWQRYSSLKWISREWFGKKGRLEKLFRRHKIAFENLKEETGLIFVHLHPSKQVHHRICITTPKKGKEILDLTDTPFVIQERAVLVPQYLSQLSPEEGKKAIAHLEAFFRKRTEKGLTDRIQTMENNYGFVGEKPIQIDFGRLRYEPEMEKEQELRRIIDNLQRWVQDKFPTLYQAEF